MGVYVVLAAGGSGTRMGQQMPKQFLTLKGKPVLAYSLLLFENCECIDKVVLVVPKGYKELGCKIVQDFGAKKVFAVIEGGNNRQESVYAGLMAIPQTAKIVLIHDGARPFLTKQYVFDLITQLLRNMAVILAVPVKETIKKVDKKGNVEETPNREQLYVAQTPQGFSYSLIMNAYHKAYADSFVGTDDASLVERLGESVHILLGSYENIKLTTKEDFLWAEYHMSK